MKKFDVTITETITKTYRVEAEDQEGAYEAAHEVFSVLSDDAKEYRNMETDSIIEVLR